MYKTSNRGERVSVYIDFRNIEGGLKEALPHNGTYIDYKKLTSAIIGNRTLINAYVFDGFFTERQYENMSLYDALRSNGFIVELSKNDSEEKIQKGVDVNIACNMLKHAFENQYDTAVILSGDGDFLPAIGMIRNMGKGVEGSGFDCSTSNDVRINCTKWHSINEMSQIFNFENDMSGD